MQATSVAASAVIFNAASHVSRYRGNGVSLSKLVNCVERSNNQSIAHCPRGRAIFRDPTFRQTCPCPKRICPEPSLTHERNQIPRRIP
jgi:hypothetical protein